MSFAVTSSVKFKKTNFAFQGTLSLQPEATTRR